MSKILRERSDALRGTPGRGAPAADPRTVRTAPSPRPGAETRPLDTGVLELSDAYGSVEQPWQPEDAIAPFTELLGPRLGAANPVWGARAIDLLRGLQKRLVEHSLTLEQSARRPALAAIDVIETSVLLRLRLQQMEMSELENDTAAGHAGNSTANG